MDLFVFCDKTCIYQLMFFRKIGFEIFFTLNLFCNICFAIKTYSRQIKCKIKNLFSISLFRNVFFILIYHHRTIMTRLLTEIDFIWAKIGSF
jgi:hypothetical protein